jgi:hypothetical protein
MAGWRFPSADICPRGWRLRCWSSANRANNPDLMGSTVATGAVWSWTPKAARTARVRKSRPHSRWARSRTCGVLSAPMSGRSASGATVSLQSHSGIEEKTAASRRNLPSSITTTRGYPPRVACSRRSATAGSSRVVECGRCSGNRGSCVRAARFHYNGSR